jgi:hypothetical protein
MMEIQLTEMDVAVHAQLKPTGHELLVAQHHKVYVMTYVGMAKK